MRSLYEYVHNYEMSMTDSMSVSWRDNRGVGHVAPFITANVPSGTIHHCLQLLPGQTRLSHFGAQAARIRVVLSSTCITSVSSLMRVALVPIESWNSF